MALRTMRVRHGRTAHWGGVTYPQGFELEASDREAARMPPADWEDVTPAAPAKSTADRDEVGAADEQAGPTDGKRRGKAGA